MKERFLDEDRGHVVSFTEYGNPEGLPILSFHGGPGSKSKSSHAERFDLAKYRVILFDQRGCGNSVPLGELKNNTTADILKDAERIREKLGIDTWFVSGSSWGATLSLLYAIEHTKRVRGMLISAVFLADRDTMVWAMQDSKGVARLMPDAWSRRMAFFKKFAIRIETQNADMLKAFEGVSLEKQKEIAAGVQNWEGNLFSLQSPVSFKTPEEITEAEIAAAKIFVYYEMNDEFVSDGYILQNIDKISVIPTVIVHGRYDILCPLEKPYFLSERMKNCTLIIAASSGHRLTAEGETILKMAFDRFLEKQG